MPYQGGLGVLCRKPTAQQISKRLLQICQKEGLQVNESTLQVLVESSNADIRLMLGQLQMIRLRKRSLSYDEAKVPAHQPCCITGHAPPYVHGPWHELNLLVVARACHVFRP
jgi:hypothetical protein